MLRKVQSLKFKVQNSKEVGSWSLAKGISFSNRRLSGKLLEISHSAFSLRSKASFAMTGERFIQGGRVSGRSAPAHPPFISSLLTCHCDRKNEAKF
jgi:hypothetical protein